MSTKYGFYSRKAADRYGSIVYKTPTGQEVEVTVIFSSPTHESYNWDDKICVGEITDYVRTVKPKLDGLISSYQKEIRRHG